MKGSVTADSCFQFIAELLWGIRNHRNKHRAHPYCLLSSVLFLFVIALKFLPLKLTVLRFLGFFNSVVRKASLVCSY